MYNWRDLKLGRMPQESRKEYLNVIEKMEQDFKDIFFSIEQKAILDELMEKTQILSELLEEINRVSTTSKDFLFWCKFAREALEIKDILFGLNNAYNIYFSTISKADKIIQMLDEAKSILDKFSTFFEKDLATFKKEISEVIKTQDAIRELDDVINKLEKEKKSP